MKKIVKLNDIFINKKNPRIIKDENFKKLVKSLKEFPEMLEIRPIVVNKDMEILGGNMRYRALQEIGIKEVPVIIAGNLSEDQQKEFLIKDNISGGEWDWDIIFNDFDTSKLLEWGLDIPDLEIKEETIKEEVTDEKEYGIFIECSSEYEQKKLFEELEERGLKCKLIG